MAEKFTCSTATGVATGTNKTLINVFAGAATPISRAKIGDLWISSVATPADQAAKFYLGRTTAVGTEGSGFTPNNLDPAGPAGAYDSGIGVFTGEPTYTANKQLLVLSVNQRASVRHVCAPGFEFLLTATQNSGAGLKSSSSTSTQAYEATILFEE